MTKIEWVQNPDGSRGITWNPVTGCTKVSAGCKNCYAERMANRLRGRFGYPADEPFRVTVHNNRVDQPLNWRKPRTIFVCSMGDLFHEAIETSDSNFVRDIFAVMSLCREHKFQLLTKRPHIAYRMLTDDFADLVEWAADGICGEHGWCSPEFEWPLPNVWLGISAENQNGFDERYDYLRRTSAAVKFISAEPLLGPINLKMPCGMCGGTGEGLGGDCPACDGSGYDTALDWVIVGGESGPNARPMHPDWVRSIRDQCKDADTPFFFKQWGEWSPSGHPQDDYTSWETSPGPTIYFDYYGKSLSEYIISNELDSIDRMMPFRRIGKKKAGHILDGVEHLEFPQPYVSS